MVILHVWFIGLRPQVVDSVEEVRCFFLQRWPVAAEQTWDCEGRLVIDVPKISPDPTLQRLVNSLRQPQTAEQLVEVPGFEFVFVRRTEGALSIAVCRAAAHTWAMLVHDTGWSGIQILGTGDVPVTSSDMFQQSSPNSVWCLSSVPRQSGGCCRLLRDRYAQCQTVHYGLD